MARVARQAQGRLTPALIGQAARQGDAAARRIWVEVGQWLGLGLANLVHLLNPDRIVIGGGVADAGEVLFRPIRRTVKAWALDLPAKHLRVVKAKLGNDAGIVGASVLVRRSLE